MPKVIHHHVITYSVLYSFVKVHTLRVDCPPLCKLLEESQPQCYFDRSFDLGSTPYRFGFIISNLGCHHHPSYHLPEKQAYIENSTPEGSLPSRKRCAYARSAYVDSHRLYGKRYGIFKVQIACLIGCVVATLSQDTFQGVSASEMLFFILFYHKSAGFTSTFCDFEQFRHIAQILLLFLCILPTRGKIPNIRLVFAYFSITPILEPF